MILTDSAYGPKQHTGLESFLSEEFFGNEQKQGLNILGGQGFKSRNIYRTGFGQSIVFAHCTPKVKTFLKELEHERDRLASKFKEMKSDTIKDKTQLDETIAFISSYQSNLKAAFLDNGIESTGITFHYTDYNDGEKKASFDICYELMSITLNLIVLLFNQFSKIASKITCNINLKAPDAFKESKMDPESKITGQFSLLLEISRKTYSLCSFVRSIGGSFDIKQTYSETSFTSMINLQEKIAKTEETYKQLAVKLEANQKNYEPKKKSKKSSKKKNKEDLDAKKSEIIKSFDELDMTNENKPESQKETMRGSGYEFDNLKNLQKTSEDLKKQLEKIKPLNLQTSEKKTSFAADCSQNFIEMLQKMIKAQALEIAFLSALRSNNHPRIPYFKEYLLYCVSKRTQECYKSVSLLFRNNAPDSSNIKHLSKLANFKSDFYLMISQYSAASYFLVKESTTTNPGGGLDTLETMDIKKGLFTHAANHIKLAVQTLNRSKWLSKHDYKAAFITTMCDLVLQLESNTLNRAKIMNHVAATSQQMIIDNIVAPTAPENFIYKEPAFDDTLELAQPKASLDISVLSELAQNKEKLMEKTQKIGKIV